MPVSIITTSNFIVEFPILTVFKTCLKFFKIFTKILVKTLCVVIFMQLVITYLTKKVKNDHNDKGSTLLTIHKNLNFDDESLSVVFLS